MGKRMELGVLLPHFSSECTWDRLIRFAPRIEELGFDSVWVRDNLSYRGHGFEIQGNTFIDPFVTLAAIAALTSSLKLGTAVAVPFRHPVLTAQLVGSLSWVSRDRFELGLGPGTPRKPWEITGIEYKDRIRLCKETAEVMRCFSSGAAASYQGELTTFSDVTIDPPPPSDMPIWYGGAGDLSIPRILDYADGMLPGRCPFRRYDVAAERLREGGAQKSKRFRFGSVPMVSVAGTFEKALGQIDYTIEPLYEYLTNRWKMPFETLQDLAGAVIIGTPDDFAEQLSAFAEREIDLVVLDARLLMGGFEQAIEMIGTEVLPKL